MRDVKWQVRSDGWYPAVVLKSAEMKFNFGAAPFKHAIRHGYVACVSAAWSDTTFARPSTVRQSGAPFGLIIEPTRELAQQVSDEFHKFKKYLSAPEITHQLFI